MASSRPLRCSVRAYFLEVQEWNQATRPSDSSGTEINGSFLRFATQNGQTASGPITDFD